MSCVSLVVSDPSIFPHVAIPCYIALPLLLFAKITVSSLEEDNSVEQMCDLVVAIKQHLRTGCISLLVSTLSDVEMRSTFMMAKIFSKRGVASMTALISTLNVSHDDTECRYNRPLYIMTEEAISAFKTGPTWLLFSSTLELDPLLEGVYIPFDCDFLVTGNEEGSNVTIVEVYRINRSTPLLYNRVGEWSPYAGLAWKTTNLYDRRENLHGLTLRATTYDNPPVVESVHNGGMLRVGGFFGAIWSLLEEELNFTTDLHLPKIKAAGASSKNGSWTGMMEDLVDQVVDVAIGDLTMTSKRAAAVDFTVPIIINRLCIFIRTPSSSFEAFQNILAPFSSRLWFTIQGAILGLAASLTVTYHVGRRYGSAEKPDLYTPPTTLLYVIGIFCLQGHEQTPRTWSCRLIYWVSYMTAIVLLAAYSGALTSFLAMQHIEPPFTTLEGLLKDGTYSVATLANSAHFNNFDQANETVMKKIYENLFQQHMPDTVLEGLDNICNKNHYSYMASYDIALALWRNLSCSIFALKDASLPETLSFAFTKDSPYLGVFNYKFQKLRVSGVLNRLRVDAWPRKLEVPKKLWSSVNIDTVTPLFIILSVGIILAAILITLEKQSRHLLHKWRRRQSSRTRKSKALFVRSAWSPDHENQKRS